MTFADLMNDINQNPNKYSDWGIQDNGMGMPIFSGWKSCCGLSLNLFDEDDLFLLVCLAACWSITGRFENPDCFAKYVKDSGNGNPHYWSNMTNINWEIHNKHVNLTTFLSTHSPRHRARISFNINFYYTYYLVAINWKSILNCFNSLKELTPENKCSKTIEFINKFYNIKIVATGNPSITSPKHMNIKIPLILRELRVQGVYANIPGEWCCIFDIRVRNNMVRCGLSYNTRGRHFLVDSHRIASNLLSLTLKRSEIIYNLCGNLYDIPLFI